ncbi:hypothetical protein [Alkalihalobacillus pseudalcaliphilus]|uniref:hypothetical protein n=1 Tax=Alkalihalobacillus pseudalcaliphilus TaxID=79884 RepID=UPI00064DB849|nr:hypothetical protein [Alkalihalobacillus pseudalcaliphilus]KMK75435.1 hypothetical protein AB990_08965 [Alkalihalobacillus pseudalcaliphilus]
MLDFIRLRNRPEPFANLLARRIEEIYESTDDATTRSSLLDLAKEFDENLGEKMFSESEIDAAYEDGHNAGYSEGYADAELLIGDE